LTISIVAVIQRKGAKDAKGRKGEGKRVFDTIYRIYRMVGVVTTASSDDTLTTDGCSVV
jgi:hypothetical protein